jgi:hypothetical protein
MHQSLPHRWLLGAAAILFSGAIQVTIAFAATTASISESYGQLPLTFEANAGQADKAVKFLSRGQGYTLFLTPAEAVLSLRGPQEETAVIRMQVAGGKREPRVVGLDPQATKSNYLLGNDPSHWQTGVSHYARVRYEDVYPGVDLIYRGNQTQLEYDFVVAPGADPGRIRLAFSGTDSIKIGPQGELVLHTAQGDLVQHPPVVYQEIGEERKIIKGHYALLPAREQADPQVGFVLGHYDHSQPLIIDPVLMYSTFLGSSGGEEARGIAIDSTGNAYITGLTNSITFPGVNGGSSQPANGGGSSDVFVTKINSTGTAILYSTFFGGAGREEGWSIAVDSAGYSYVTGPTDSATLPGVNGSSLQQTLGGGVRDGFVLKLNPTGTAIVYSTFLGGNRVDLGAGIAVDGAGNTYVTGYTESTTFLGINGSSLQPTHAGGVEDAFVTKLNPTGTAIIYSTFLGGNRFDRGLSIAVDISGNAYVTGRTESDTFPGVNGSSIQPSNLNSGGGGAADAFVTKLNPSGTAILYSTFLGGNGDDRGLGIAVDGAGSVYVAGFTFSDTSTFIGVNSSSIQSTYGGSGDSFVMKINPPGTAVLYSTFLGGSEQDVGLGIAVDGAGNSFVTGATLSTTFPGVNGSSIQPATAGSGDAFVTKINQTGTAIVYSTFLGGSAADGGAGIAVDSAGNAYITGITGSSTFPGVTGSSIQPAIGGFADAFVTKIGKAAPTLIAQASVSITVGGSISDTATLSGGASPTGTITFTLFGPNNAACTGSPIFTSTKSVTGNGNYVSDPFTTLSVGTYRWVASYDGDTNNNAAGPTNCADPAETVVVASASPTLTTQASPSVTVGGSISDTATLVSGANPTGTITFNLFGPNNASCSGSPIFTSTKAVNGNGNYASDPFVTSSAGTYRWVANYGGDTNNNGTGPTSCSDPAETVIVTAASPTVTTQASPAVTAGGAISDTATLAGGANPTGTITFTLFGPNNADCSGSPIFTFTKTVTGNGSYTSDPFTASSAGTYRWVASYGGDSNNNASGPTSCADPAETVVVTAASPTLTTLASPSVTVGGAINDAATLAGGAGATGTITFKLFGPNNASCTGSPIFTSTKTVTGNGTYTSDSFTTSSAGTYRWIANYGGDSNNNSAGPTSCTDPTETVVVTAASPTLTTQASLSVTVGGSISDTATLAGGASPTGTITFKLFGPNNASCTGSPVLTSTKTIIGNGNYASDPFTASSAGTYRWVANYSGDSNNNSAGPTSCTDPAEAVVVTSASPTLTTQASPSITVGGLINDTATLAGGASPTGTITFKLFGPNNASCTGSPVFTSTKTVAGNGSYASDLFTTVSAGTYRWVASYSGDANNNAAGPISCTDPAETVVVRAGLAFFTVTPCRLVDTRNANGPLGGPVLQSGATRVFVVTGVCGVPASAKAVSVNLAVTQPTAGGYLSFMPGDLSGPPTTSAISYASGQTRANNFVARLALDGSGSLKVFSASNVHFILDVNGYFE